MFFRFVKFLWFISIIVVVYFSLIKHINFRNFDKEYHFLAYVWLAAVPFIGFQRVKISLAGAILMIPLGIGLEYAQDFVHGRIFAVADMISNCAGVVLGMALGRFLKSRFFVRL